MTAFTPSDLEQIKELAEHLQHAAPLIRPENGGERLPVELLVRDIVGSAVAVSIVVRDGSEPLITFPEGSS